MPVIHRTALLPYPAADVFAIVGDVERYPEFLPGCREAVVLESAHHEVVAELEVHTRGVHERFATRNVLYPHERIELHLVSGPFSSFEGVWHFKRLGDDAGCKVTLDLDFELSGARGLIGSAFSGIFVKAADRVVDAFCQRSHAVLA